MNDPTVVNDPFIQSTFLIWEYRGSSLNSHRLFPWIHTHDTRAKPASVTFDEMYWLCVMGTLSMVCYNAYITG